MIIAHRNCDLGWGDNRKQRVQKVGGSAKMDEKKDKKVVGGNDKHASRCKGGFWW